MNLQITQADIDRGVSVKREGSKGQEKQVRYFAATKIVASAAVTCAGKPLYAEVMGDHVYLWQSTDGKNQPTLYHISKELRAWMSNPSWKSDSSAEDMVEILPASFELEGVK